MQLIGLSYSPWTEKARWALDHHRLSYRYIEHLPMLGELPLRWKARRPTGRVTVPLLVTDGGPIMDSLAIAEHADRAGSQSPLLPADKRRDIDAWNARSERILAAGRGLVVARTAQNERAKQEALPPFVPDSLRPAMSGVASMGLVFFRAKYKLHTAGEHERRSAIAEELRALREGLGGKPYLLGDFSYADVVMAACLQLVKPADERFVDLKEGTREVWTDPDLCAEFGDLATWRDEVYSKHRC